MEKNCLVTKYKATVNDNSLLKIGEMVLDIIKQDTPTDRTNVLHLASNISDLTIEVEGGMMNLTLDSNMTTGWTNKIVIPANLAKYPVYVRNGNYRIKLTSKYNVKNIGLGENMNSAAIKVNTKYLVFSNYITSLVAQLTGNLADLSDCINLINISNCNKTTDIEGSLSDLAPLTSLTKLYLESANKVTGSISDLAPLTSLRELALTNDTSIVGDISDLSNPLIVIYLGGTKVKGEIIEFVKTQRANGRTTGNCTINDWRLVLTFNGVATNGGNVTWTENTITLGDVTVNQ